MLKKLGGALVVLAATAAVGSCGGPPAGETTTSGCPDGSTRRESDGLSTHALESREAAIRLQLKNLGEEASDDAIAAGIVRSSQDASGGENVEVQTSSGLVTITLLPQMPGWKVARSTWCAPDET